MYLDSYSKPLGSSKLTASSIEVMAQVRLIKCRGSIKISNAKKPITYSFEAQIKIRLNRYLKDNISHLLEGFLERETLHLCGMGFVTKFSLLQHTKVFQSKSEDSIGEEAQIITTIAD